MRSVALHGALTSPRSPASERLQMPQDGLKHRRPQRSAALAVPSNPLVRQIRVVLEWHLKRQRQTSELIAHIFGRQLQRVRLVLARFIAVHVLKIGTRLLEAFNERLLFLRLLFS